MIISAEERKIIEQTLEYCDSGKTTMIDEVMLNPVTNYNDPKKLDDEINILFRKFPIIVAHISEISLLLKSRILNGNWGNVMLYSTVVTR